MKMTRISQKLHDLRMKFDIFKINYRHHRYSTSKNPRVISGRLPNSTLFSLRTNPHDKYLLRQGDFFGFSGEFIDEEGEEVEEEYQDITGIRERQSENEPLLIGGESFNLTHLSRKEVTSVDDDTILRHSKSAPDLITFKKNGTILSNGHDCICSCHHSEDDVNNGCNHNSINEVQYQPIQGPYSPNIDVSPEQQEAKKSYHRFFGFNRKRKNTSSKLANIPSPIIELNTGSTGLDGVVYSEVIASQRGAMPIILQNNDGYIKGSNFDIGGSSGTYIQKNASNISRKPSYMFQSIGSSKGNLRSLGGYTRNMTISSIGSRGTNTTGFSDVHPETDVYAAGLCNCQKCERKRGITQESAWKTILNDVSLSAARISTGALPKSKSYTNLNSDFTSAKYDSFNYTGPTISSRKAVYSFPLITTSKAHLKETHNGTPEKKGDKDKSDAEVKITSLNTIRNGSLSELDGSTPKKAVINKGPNESLKNMVLRYTDGSNTRPSTSHSDVIPLDLNCYQLVSPAYSGIFSNYCNSDTGTAAWRSTRRSAILTTNDQAESSFDFLVKENEINKLANEFQHEVSFDKENIGANFDAENTVC